MTTNAASDSLFSPSSWIEALDISERYKCLTSYKTTELTDKGNYLYSKWLEQSPFDENEFFHCLMSAHGINKKEFQAIINDTAEYDLTRIDFSWLNSLRDSYTHNFHSKPPEGIRINLKESEFARPIVNSAINSLREKLVNIVKLSSSSVDEAIQLFLPLLSNRLHKLIIKAFIYEINVARKNDLLGGPSPEERYKEFLLLFTEQEFCINFLLKFKVLARKVAIVVSQWEHFCHSFYTNLENDFSLIEDTFSADTNLGFIETLTRNASDYHNGKCVLIAGFQNGTSVVYKPRPLDADECYGKFAEWVNRKTDAHIKYAKILNLSDYGWCEYIKHKENPTLKLESYFYYSYGAILSLAYLLQCNDLHDENVIACSGDPVVIDLETLCHPIKPECFTTKSNDNYKEFSVLKTRILPNYQKEDATELDSSALFSIKGQKSSTKNKMLVKRFTDEIRYEYSDLYSSARKNLQFRGEKYINPENYKNYFIDGFSKTYVCFMKHKGELLTLLSDCESIFTRVLVNNTKSYSSLISGSTHPIKLTDGLEQDIHFECLRSNWTFTPNVNSIATMEIDALKDMNIPTFYAFNNGLDLHLSKENFISEVLKQSSLTDIKERIRKLCSSDCEIQVDHIKRGFYQATNNNSLQELYRHKKTR